MSRSVLAFLAFVLAACLANCRAAPYSGRGGYASATAATATLLAATGDQPPTPLAHLEQWGARHLPAPAEAAAEGLAASFVP